MRLGGMVALEDMSVVPEQLRCAGIMVRARQTERGATHGRPHHNIYAPTALEGPTRAIFLLENHKVISSGRRDLQLREPCFKNLQINIRRGMPRTR